MLNYLGQLRLYSLLDLVILLIATKATAFEFVGVIILHVGFLAYLESRHHHSNRKKVPKYLWIIFAIIGSIFYGHIEGVIFIICSYFYTLKNQKHFALFSPLLRGLQCFFLVAGIVGYDSKLAWLVLVLLVLRNLFGDLRDITKDKKEGMKTLPMVIGLTRDSKNIHLIFTLITTLFWFQFTELNIWLLIPIFLVQILTYRLTPR